MSPNPETIITVDDGASVATNGSISRGRIKEFPQRGDEELLGVKYAAFCERIGRPDIARNITPTTPYGYWSMEIYRDDIKGQGGLGMLASDTLEVAVQEGIPMVVVTPFYTEEFHQTIQRTGDGKNIFFRQEQVQIPVSPTEKGFRALGSVVIKSLGHESVPLYVYHKREGSVDLVAITEPDFGYLYFGKNDSDHRLYQEVSLGFGGYKALKEIGLTPAVHQLNEAPTLFASLARLDDRFEELQKGSDTQNSQELLLQAISDIRSNTIYTNHTLVQAVEAEFTIQQFEHFVLPNLEHNEIKDWLRHLFARKGGRMCLSTLAIELSGTKNGVSLIHAREASKEYEDIDGNKVEFAGITNGISLPRWMNPDLLAMYEDNGILDEFGLPQKGFQEAIKNIPDTDLAEKKQEGRLKLRLALRDRQDQYGNEIEIPHDAKVYTWRRRIAEYKRPGMLFDEPEALANMLQEENIHIVMAGKAHAADNDMQRELSRFLQVIDQNPILRKRVHFLQDYDENISRALAQGSDASINTPRVRDNITGKRKSTEACGTSWMKDVVNNTILISTDDGGIADFSVEKEEEGLIDAAKPYIHIIGRTHPEEGMSLYAQIQKASAIIDGRDEGISWGDQVKKQTAAFLPIASGARMEAMYLNVAIPKPSASRNKMAA